MAILFVLFFFISFVRIFIQKPHGPSIELGVGSTLNREPCDFGSWYCMRKSYSLTNIFENIVTDRQTDSIVVVDVVINYFKNL